MLNVYKMKETVTHGEQGTLIFWDPIIQRALTDQSALQWICSARRVFGRIYDLCIIAKVGAGWYLSDRQQPPGIFAYPINIRFALEPELLYDDEIEAISSLQPQNALKQTVTPFRKKLYYTQRLEIPMSKNRLNGSIVYEVFKNEVMQPSARTNFSILLKE